MPAPQKIKLPIRQHRPDYRFCWWALLSGILCGVLGTWLIMSKTIDITPFLSSAKKDHDKPVTLTEQTTQSDNNQILDNLPIEFYKLLPNREQRIDDHVISQQAQKPIAQDRVDQASQYRILAGSFQKLNDANRRRQAIAILGLSSHIEKITHGGRVWHRVILGPFESLRLLEAAKQRLTTHQINTIVLKLKNPT